MALTLEPCDCCGNEPAGCDCCPEGPDQDVPFTLTLTFNDDLEWDVDDPTTCDRIIFASGTPYDFTLSADCSWSRPFDPFECNGSAFVTCSDGVWYFNLSIFYNTVLYQAIFALPDFSCCTQEQTLDMDPVSVDPIFITVPTEVLIESVGCPIDNECCDQVPPVLTVTFTGNIVATVEITYDSGSGTWQGVLLDVGCTNPLTISFACVDISGFVWEMSLVFDTKTPIAPFTGTLTDCDPFLWSGSATANDDTCIGSFTATVSA